MAFSRTVPVTPLFLIPLVVVAACVSQPQQASQTHKAAAKTLNDGSPVISVTEDRSAQPRMATYSCTNDVTMTIENLGTSIRLRESDDDVEEELPASPANQRSRFGAQHDAVVLDGREALVMRGGRRPITCKR